MWMWVKRHKKKLVVLLLAAGGAYVGGRYLLRKMGEMQEGQRSSRVEEARCKEHFEANQHTCLSTVLKLVPTMRDTICVHLDAEGITAQLRTRPANKVTLWENLKIISFTRLVAGVYACSLLSVFVRVQLSLLGGCMFQDLHRAHQSPEQAPADAQKQYLSIVQYFLQEGVTSLIRAVQQSTEAILAGYSLKQQLSCEGVLQLISDIRSQLAGPAHTQQRHRRSFLVQYLMPKEPLLQTQSTDSQAGMLIAATRDILESGDFSYVLETTVDHAFSQLQPGITEAYHSAAPSSPLLPLARIIPLVTDHVHAVLSHQHSSLAQELLSAGNLKKLSENVYEAFRHDS